MAANWIDVQTNHKLKGLFKAGQAKSLTSQPTTFTIQKEY